MPPIGARRKAQGARRRLLGRRAAAPGRGPSPRPAPWIALLSYAHLGSLYAHTLYSYHHFSNSMQGTVRTEVYVYVYVYVSNGMQGLRRPGQCDGRRATA